jgi:hypothetical protein
MSVRLVGDLVFTLVILTVIVASLSVTFGWPYSARLVPWAIGVPATLLCLFLLARGIWRMARGTAPHEIAKVMDIQRDQGIPTAVFAARASAMFAWVFGFAGAAWLIGFLPAVPIFVFLYILLQGGERWWTAISLSAGMFAVMASVFHFILHVAWMRGQYNELQRQIIGLLNQLY